MPRRTALAAVVFLVSATLPQGQSAPDLARLQGTWSMVSGSAGGQPLPPDYVKTMKRVAVGDTVTITRGGQLFFQAAIDIDAKQTPRTIDYRMLAGPTAGAVQLGIYAFSGDTVRFCFGAPGAPRPADFTSVAGDGRTLSAWVRAKP